MQFDWLRRREFIALLGGAAAAWPLAARAQQPERMRRIGVLMSYAADDPAGQTRLLAFAQALAQTGWTDGRNVRIDIRWGAGRPERIRGYAAELVALAPDAILAIASTTTGPLLQATRTVPIVFVQVAEPVAAGFVETLARPGGNATGFMLYEYGIGGKWLGLLKEIAPAVKRVAFLQTPGIAAGPGQFGAIQALAPSLGVEVRPINAGDASEIDRAVTAFARSSNGGLIVAGGLAASLHRDGIIKLAARHRLPALSSDTLFATEGGLLAYGPDRVDQFRRAADYVDRILKGEKPAELPVQAPTKYELVINMKTAKALGLEVPVPLLARADEVIE
jgi:putative ABC transport system substrate-binding protein